jgi:hypothetical protein
MTKPSLVVSLLHSCGRPFKDYRHSCGSGTPKCPEKFPTVPEPRDFWLLKNRLISIQIISLCNSNLSNYARSNEFHNPPVDRPSRLFTCLTTHHESSQATPSCLFQRQETGSCCGSGRAYRTGKQDRPSMSYMASASSAPSTPLPVIPW